MGSIFLLLRSKKILPIQDSSASQAHGSGTGDSACGEAAREALPGSYALLKDHRIKI
jgi:hypothetical protein